MDKLQEEFKIRCQEIAHLTNMPDDYKNICIDFALLVFKSYSTTKPKEA